MESDLTLCTLPFSTLSLSECVARCEAWMRSGGCHVLHTVNAQALILCRQSRWQALFSQADLIVPDGDGVLLAARLCNKRFPHGRVAGIDLLQGLLSMCAASGFRVYLLGGKEGVAQSAAQRLCQADPRLCICGTHHGYFDPAGEENEEVLRDIRAARPDFVAVCLGMPRQEQWIAQNAPRLPAALWGGFGGSLDVLSGKLRRAPRWMQRLHAEWLYRALRQPARFLRLLDYPGFFLRLWLAGEAEIPAKAGKKNQKAT